MHETAKQDSAPERRVPALSFPAELPIAERREEIMAAIRDHQVVIVAGETGSGKTTQLPKICLELGRGRRQRIGHTQPRRLAARTVAQRIASEIGTPLGETVGYQVRFNDQVSDASAIKLMTDGILLAEIQRDRLLRQYDTLIIDEAHERSLNIDFLLGYLKNILPQRPDLKLVITSATIDLESFSRHFDDAPIIEVSGRTYPVETVYVDPAEDRDQGLQAQIVNLALDIERGRFGERGDVLVFLPGERDIRELAKALRRDTELEILPLYARLGQSEQQRVFDLSRRRGTRVVLATNVAETSVTVPGIRYVIDPGEARISRYSFRTKVQRLPIEPISQASANQRKGRCGRVAAGVCIRLYSEEDFERRPEFTDPEIHRTNLAAVILQMLNLRLGELRDFPFIDPPDARMVRDGYKLLEELGAVSPAGKLTAVGRQMTRLPVDPRLARMILAAAEGGCLAEVLVVVSALSIQDPRERPADKRQQADQAHARFRHPKSDFLAWLALWRYYEEQRQALSQNQLRKLCLREFLSFMRMREWRDIHGQLLIACRQQGLKPARELPAEEDYAGIHKALLAGLLGNIAQYLEGRDYLGARNRKLQIFPGSSQARKRPKWLVAAEIVETSGVYAREVGGIDPAWALEVNPSLLKKHYYEPRWQARSGRAVAYERVTLYGLTLADKRTVHYGPINPVESRELLIREGLIGDKLKPPPAFLKHKQRLVRELEDLESRARRRDILVDEEVLFNFYDERLPPEACTLKHLNSWLKSEPGADAALRVPRDLLLARDPGADLGEQFPDHLEWQDLKLRLSYQFEPGKAADGVSVTVPVGLLNRVPRHRFDYLVPGLLREKCIQLVKGLPKQQRKHLVPVPDYVDRVLADMPVDDSDLLQALATGLSRVAGVKLQASDFDSARVDDFYRMNVRVVDAEGKLLGQGRDLPALVQQFRSDTRDTVGAVGDDSPVRDKVTRWDIGALPREWRVRQAGVDIVSYPALVDSGESAAVELLDYPGKAWLAHRRGVLKLARLHNAQQVKYLRKQLLRGNDSNLALAGAGLERGALLEDLVDGAFAQALELDSELPYDEAGFQQLLQRGGAPVVEAANELETQLLSSLVPLARARERLARLGDAQWREAREDIERQLAALLAEGFLRDTPAQWLGQYPRYMKALLQRVERLAGQLEKDRRHTALLADLWQPLDAQSRQRGGLLLLSEPARRYRWMHEEFRVSLFAQQLGTRMPVSEKRLREQWEQVAQWLAANPH
ncbi:ATP-dependent RNA helicase HrpA [Parahaliea mediterranea]|uniref:ATP-dependent RNA helicase HrpA n=1 Tax=Parahaliea mediterranea TaxID=651086 RepID=A0A939DEJ4_9GAMM|nr:ATP-dependent RNA helicase HrpA [Parahaliea mediterranea]MBN7796684.1 ATP-dependent RNA helicase HrpA [Parahaliea mediterranea]